MRFPHLFILIWLSPAVVLAQSYFPPMGPIPIRNQNPLALQSLEMRPQRTTVLPRGALQLEGDVAYSNVFERGSSSRTGYEAVLDMELLRHSFLFHYGLLDQFQIGLELPLLHFDSGFLDSFVQDFHDFFGHPNGGREKFSNGVFAFAIRKRGETLYEVSEQEYGLSDLVLDFKHQIREEEGWVPGLASLFYLKLPTGDRGRGLGSGSPDFGFQIVSEKNHGRYHGTVNLGYFIHGGNGLLGEIAKGTFFSWTVGLEMSLIRDLWSGMVQLSGDSGHFSGSGLKLLDESALNLTVGFGGKIGNDHQWKFAFEEDPDMNGAGIDFTVWFQWAYTWRMPTRIKGLLWGKAD